MTSLRVRVFATLATLGAAASSISTTAMAESSFAPIGDGFQDKAQALPSQQEPALAVNQATNFDTFAPGAKPIQHTIDYSIWDYALRNTVFSMGPSVRKSLGKPTAATGTRRIYGADSRYRLEGSMVLFSFFDREVIASFGEYRRDLESVADTLDIQSLSRNEQLAYWLNLHNVAMMEQLSNNWPMRQPREFKIDGVPLDDAKFITVEGVKLSLRDIREQIVYKHWKDPKVIYGFWRGEIGSPALQRDAFNASNVNGVLDRAAQEFVNSLRGTQKRGDSLDVSELYAETARFFFPNFAQDVRAHLARYAGEEVSAIMAETSGTEPAIREYDIADLAGGVREPSYTNLMDGRTGRPRSFRVPLQMATLLEQRTRKYEWMQRNGIPTGTVTFNFIDLPGQEATAKEVE